MFVLVFAADEGFVDLDNATQLRFRGLSGRSNAYRKPHRVNSNFDLDTQTLED